MKSLKVKRMLDEMPDEVKEKSKEIADNLLRDYRYQVYSHINFPKRKLTNGQYDSIERIIFNNINEKLKSVDRHGVFQEPPEFWSDEYKQVWDSIWNLYDDILLDLKLFLR